MGLHAIMKQLKQAELLLEDNGCFFWRHWCWHFLTLLKGRWYCLRKCRYKANQEPKQPVAGRTIVERCCFF
jgi:hypothetical protein